MPLLASASVMLCVIMVLVTWSVMGGFLKMLIDSGRTLVGDVVINWPNTGFPHYDDLIKRLEADPAVKAAAPMIESFGLVGLPDGRTPSVMIKGIEPDSFNAVTDFFDVLWWKPNSTPLEKDKLKEDPRLGPNTRFWQALENQGKTLKRFDPETNEFRPAVVMGIEVSGFNIREPSGIYVPGGRRVRNPDGTSQIVDDFLPDRGSVTLHVLPLDRKGRSVEMTTRSFPVANEFRTGVFQFDKQMVFVPLHELQRMLKMDAAKRLKDDKDRGRPVLVTDPDTGEQKFVIPGADDPSRIVEDSARVTTVVVRAADGVNARELQKRIRNQIYPAFEQAHRGEVPSEFSIEILTWEDLNATFIGAVKKETALVLFLFTIISFVAVFLVLAIFWSMVSEKTKDIGVIRSLGAGGTGVAGMWLTYGFAIGVVGAALGGVGAYLIVSNINPIHEWLGTTFGLLIWDPKIYYFTKIPNEIVPERAAIVIGGGILSSVLGAVVPAIRAATMDPVKALRFE